MYNAIYNGKNLGIGDYQITKIDITMPKTKVAKYELVQADGQIVTSRFLGERVINISGRILANTLDEMQSRLDTLKSWSVGYEKPLDITIGVTNRRYTATVQNFSYSTQGYFCQWSLDFTCDSLASDPNTTSLTFGTYTTSGTSYSNTIGGNYYAELNLDFTLNRALPYWTNSYIEFKNTLTNDRMRFTRTWLPSDRVVVNGKTKTATIYAGTATVIDTMDTITNWASSQTLSLETANQLEGVGCAKIVMASAGLSSNVVRYISSPSVNLSSTQGIVLVPVFIPTPTSGSVSTVRLNIGSDSSTLATNSMYWDKTTQWDGSALATNAWNYIAFDLSLAATSTTGTPNRNAIISIEVSLRSGSNFQLNGWRLDYLIKYITSNTPTTFDYQGTFLELDTGSSTVNVSDELTSRNITITGNYYKRWL